MTLWPVASLSIFPAAEELAALKHTQEAGQYLLAKGAEKTDKLKRALIGLSVNYPAGPNIVPY